MSDDIMVLDDFLPAGTFESLARCIRAEPMVYGSRSNAKTDPHGHWSRNFARAGRLNLADVSEDLEESPTGGPLSATWRFLRDTQLHNNVLIRCYANGYTYGTEGYFHTDSERPDEHSAILYMNEYWEPDWAGETAFLGRDGDIIASVLPKMNRAVIFNANIQHAGRSVSRRCMALRTTLIFKARKRRSDDFEKLSAFLRKAGATQYEHRSGTLHDHLVRTFSNLEAKGCSSSVAFGGGLHAVYGTDAFPHRVAGPSDKATIADTFGPMAEELARLFSELQRPETLESPHELTPEYAVVELRGGGTTRLPRETFDDLRKIECANLVDQAALTKYKALSKLWRSF